MRLSFSMSALLAAVLLLSVPAKAGDRVISGGWETLGPPLGVLDRQGCSGGTVGRIVVGDDGLIYFGGWGITRCGNTEGRDIFAYDPEANEFLALGGGINPGAGNIVDDMVWFQGSLYISGRFTSVGGVEVPAGIARWDGSQWHPVGGPLADFHARVQSLVVHDNNLFAAGVFYPPGAIDENGPGPCRIGRWDGSQWHKVVDCRGGTNPTYLYGQPLGLHSTPSGLLAAGNFWLGNNASYCGSPVKGIGLFSSTAWPAVPQALPAGSGLRYGPSHNNPGIYPVYQFQEAFYAGGGQDLRMPFCNDGNLSFVTVGALVRYNPEAEVWDPVGGLHSLSGRAPDDPLFPGNAAVYDMLSHDGVLYAAGSFRYAGGRIVNNIVRWNGSRWSGLGTGWDRPSNCNQRVNAGSDGTIWALAVHDGYLYVGGSFSTMNRPEGPSGTWAANGGISSTRIARYRLDHSAVQNDLVFGDAFCANP